MNMIITVQQIKETVNEKKKKKKKKKKKVV